LQLFENQAPRRSPGLDLIESDQPKSFFAVWAIRTPW